MSYNQQRLVLAVGEPVITCPPLSVQVVKIGKSLATINVTFSRKSDGAAVAVATHTKFIQAATGSKAATGFVRSRL